METVETDETKYVQACLECGSLLPLFTAQASLRTPKRMAQSFAVQKLCGILAAAR